MKLSVHKSVQNILDSKQSTRIQSQQHATLVML